ncbi:MAG: NAD(P)H-hydrate dehydratase [Paracoccaceae bacterium]
MTELLTAAQMRAIEQAAIDSGEVTGLELMERAGRGVVEAIFEEWPELRATSHRAVVLCGPGNNGGDGFVVARLLKEWGWEVEVFLYGDPDKLPPDARVNYERWGALGRTLFLGFPEPSRNEITEVGETIEGGTSLVIDAVFGRGLTRPATQGCRSLFQEVDMIVRSLGAYRVAIDLPSGLCSDSGKRVDPTEDGRLDYSSFDAQLTVSFHQSKVGHWIGEGPDFSGRVICADIGLKDRPRPEGGGDLSPPPWGAGLGRSGADTPEQVVTLVSPDTIEFDKWRGDHKYTHGHALVLSGGPGKTGAARLAARGALRIGAGLVTLACPPNTLSEVAAHVTAIMCRPLDGAPGLREMLEDERLNALCLGPGMGLGADTQALVIEALKSKRSIVLDADALTRFERNPQTLFDLLHDRCVLTPHAGEFKRLFPVIAEKLNAPATAGPAYSKVDATREAAKRAGCTVLFKGPDTVIADQTGRCSINSSAYDRAAPWLATAGSGDVLAGFITGLLARGFAPMQAAETAAWLHTECALSFGRGLIAEDLPEELPNVFSRLLKPET